MASKNWIAGAVKRPGAFSAKAKAAGESTQAYAKKEASNPKASSRTKKQAVLARNFAKMRHKGRKTKRSTKRSSRR